MAVVSGKRRARVRTATTLALVAVFLGTGCRGLSVTSPTQNLTGTYTGTIQDSSAGTGQVTVQLNDVSGALSGTWQGSGAGLLATTYHVTGRSNEIGDIEFTVSRNVVIDHLGIASMVWLDGGCAYRMTGTARDRAIVATFETRSCAPQRTGSVTLTR